MADSVGSWAELVSKARLLSIVETLLALLVITVGTSIVIKIVRPAVERFFRLRKDGTRRGGIDERRARTLADLTRSVLTYVIYFVAVMAALDRLGIDTRSLLAAAGVVGLAIGFGAQNLVRDFVTGFLILLEDQYAIGDYVTVAGVSGVVESVGIRTTQVRSFGGEVHIIPNGKIDQVTNHMGRAMRVLFPVRIPYEEDLDYVIGVLEELFAEVTEELDDILEGPRILGVQDLSESGVELSIWARAKPMTQWAMTRELRGRVKRRLDERGITIPYGRRYVIFDRDRRGGDERAVSG